jgi:hypothetical protein
MKTLNYKCSDIFSCCMSYDAFVGSQVNRAAECLARILPVRLTRDPLFVESNSTRPRIDRIAFKRNAFGIVCGRFFLSPTCLDVSA